MAKATIFCVQPFWNDGRKLAHGCLRQFTEEGRALRAGAVAAGRNSGVIVYAVDGDPDFEEWGRPRLLAVHGDVPPVSF